MDKNIKLLKLTEDKKKAVEYLNEIDRIIADICESAFGEMGTVATNPNATLVKYGRCHVLNVWEKVNIKHCMKPQKRIVENLLYRYKGITENYPGASEENNRRWATIGFIVGNESYGKLLVETEGILFWDNFRKVVEWIPILIEELDIEENKRSELLTIANIQISTDR